MKVELRNVQWQDFNERKNSAMLEAEVFVNGKMSGLVSSWGEEGDHGGSGRWLNWRRVEERVGQLVQALHREFQSKGPRAK